SSSDSSSGSASSEEDEKPKKRKKSSNEKDEKKMVLSQLPLYQDDSLPFTEYLSLAQEKYKPSRILKGIESKIQHTTTLRQYLAAKKRRTVRKAHNSSKRLRRIIKIFRNELQDPDAGMEKLEDCKQDQNQNPQEWYKKFCEALAELPEDKLPFSEVVRYAERNAQKNVRGIIVQDKPRNATQLAAAIGKAEKLFG
ncbi:unnamed protein product, partial [Amoebophrya sp. A120]